MTEMERSGIEVISCLRSNPGGKPGMLAFGDFCSGVFLYDNCGRIELYKIVVYIEVYHEYFYFAFSPK